MTLNPKSWRNADGLNVWFGTKEGTSGLAGEVLTFGDNRPQEYVITMTDLTASAQVLDEHNDLPTGAFIEQIELVTLVAITGSSSTLSIGILDDDDTTNVSDTALVNAATLASIAAVGTKLTINVGSTAVGSSVGQTISSTLNGIVTAKFGTAAFTAGKLLVRIFWNTAGQLSSTTGAKDV